MSSRIGKKLESKDRKESLLLLEGGRTFSMWMAMLFRSDCLSVHFGPENQKVRTFAATRGRFCDHNRTRGIKNCCLSEFSCLRIERKKKKKEKGEQS